MTFEEVSKKFPLDCVMGDFYTYSLTEENLKFKLDFYDAWQYGEFFSFNRKDNKYYAHCFQDIRCEGYITMDGIDFHAYGTADDYSIQYLDEMNSCCFIEPEIVDKNDFYYKRIEDFFQEQNPYSIIIRCKKDLLQVKQYEF